MSPASYQAAPPRVVNVLIYIKNPEKSSPLEPPLKDKCSIGIKFTFVGINVFNNHSLLYLQIFDFLGKLYIYLLITLTNNSQKPILFEYGFKFLIVFSFFPEGIQEFLNFSGFSSLSISSKVSSLVFLISFSCPTMQRL